MTTAGTTARDQRRAVRPSGQERVLEPDDLIVSKTDLRGVITYANESFLRVSRYEEDEVLGRPHNLIRHPDMPKAVFALLWDTVAAGQEVFAYVNNLAADGAHYWVLANVTPSYDARGTIVGYHSSRRTPTRPAIAGASAVYDQLRAAERAQPNGRAAVEASTALLGTLLADRGQTYDEFVWSLISEGGF
ncbi:aerotaxis receptor Aer [Modestobacter sp. VKM Ac-2676]|nr:aerotaxis receptor Aer [Modestobacter sp. VKM Ac-2676]